MAKKGYYAVHKGRHTGVYSSWDECKAQVNGYNGASFKKMDSYQEARAFANNGTSGKNDGRTRVHHKNTSKRSYDVSKRPYGSYSGGNSHNNRLDNKLYNRVSCNNAEGNVGSSNGTYTVSAIGVSKSSSRGKSTRKFYSVKSSNPNIENKIFNSWSECESYVKGQRGLSFKSFPDEASARSYIDGSIGDAVDFKHIGISKDEFQTKYKIDESTKYDKISRVFCDGSALSNGKSRSRAGYGVYFEDHPEKSLSRRLRSGPQTNNRAEIEAVSSALDTIWDDLLMNPLKSNYEIHTDSEYVSKLLNDRYATYDDSKLKDLPNGDLAIPMIQKFARIRQYYLLNKHAFNSEGKFAIIWVKGHAGEVGNERADELARLGAAKEE